MIAFADICQYCGDAIIRIANLLPTGLFCVCIYTHRWEYEDRCTHALLRRKSSLEDGFSGDGNKTLNATMRGLTVRETQAAVTTVRSWLAGFERLQQLASKMAPAATRVVAVAAAAAAAAAGQLPRQPRSIISIVTRWRLNSRRTRTNRPSRARLSQFVAVVNLKKNSLFCNYWATSLEVYDTMNTSCSDHQCFVLLSSVLMQPILMCNRNKYKPAQ